MNLFWRKVLQVPQTYLLVIGIILGLSLFFHWVGIRLLTLMIGGFISLAMIGAWLKQLASLVNAAEVNLLDLDSFSQRLRKIASKLRQRTSNPWKEAENYAKKSRQFCQKIIERDSILSTDLLETLYTVLDLSDQVAEAILALEQVQTQEYRSLAQDHLNTSLTRLKETHHQLQQLQDQVLLSSLESPQSRTNIPFSLQTLINDNRSALKNIIQDSNQDNGDLV